jgi:hypothetical protein
MLSPHGYPDPMRGRFGYLHDTHENIRVGLESLKAIVQKKCIKPLCIFALPGRGSQIVAAAASLVFDLPLSDWPMADGTTKPGIIVGYNFGEIELNLEPLSNHHPNQLLFSHAMDWTVGLPIAPDVLTLQQQRLTPPWEADSRPAATIAQEISGIDISSIGLPDNDHAGGGQQAPPSLSDSFLDVVGPLPRESGVRQQAWPNSPVKSKRI